jgi:hypothetical protein
MRLLKRSCECCFPVFIFFFFFHIIPSAAIFWSIGMWLTPSSESFVCYHHCVYVDLVLYPCISCCGHLCLSFILMCSSYLLVYVFNLFDSWLVQLIIPSMLYTNGSKIMLRRPQGICDQYSVGLQIHFCKGRFEVYLFY